MSVCDLSGEVKRTRDTILALAICLVLSSVTNNNL